MASPYSVFQRQYRDDPAAFVRDCFKWPAGRGPYFYQEEILAALVEHDRVCVRGPHGLGKSAVMSWGLLWFALTRDGEDWKAPVTASAWRQLAKYLWPELHKWARALDWQKIGRGPFDTRSELLTLNLKLSTGEAFTMASDNPELIEGAHAEQLFYVFDESKAVPDLTWDSAEGAFSTGSAKWLAASTPGESLGRFFEIQSRKPGFEDWRVVHITLDDCIRAGSIKPEWAADRARQWGEQSPVYLNRVKGEFAESSKDGVIPLAWLEKANERWEDWRDAGFPGRLTALGVDVGGGGEGADKSTLAPVIDSVRVREVREQDVSDPMTSTMQLTGQIAGLLEGYARRERVQARYLLAVIDSVGVGLGTLHRLRELGYNARGFGAGKSTEFRDKSGELGFSDWRSAGWWLLREMLDPSSGIPVCLPPDSEAGGTLAGDLTAPRWVVTSNGQIRVESKDKLRVRLRRSTDAADAVIEGIVGPLLLDEEAQEGQAQFRVLEI
jgi:hypothetical protein